MYVACYLPLAKRVTTSSEKAVFRADEVTKQTYEKVVSHIDGG